MEPTLTSQLLFPPPREVTGGSNLKYSSRVSDLYKVSVPSRGDWGVLLTVRYDCSLKLYVSVPSRGDWGVLQDIHKLSNVFRGVSVPFRGDWGGLLLRSCFDCNYRICVSVPSRGDWGVLRTMKPKMVYSQVRFRPLQRWLEVLTNYLILQYYFLKKFPYPFEVTGGSNSLWWRTEEWNWNVSVPSRGDWGVLLRRHCRAKLQ